MNFQINNLQELTNVEKVNTNGGEDGDFMHDLGYATAWLMDHTFGAVDDYFSSLYRWNP